MTTRRAAKEPCIPLMRELAQTYQAFASYDAALLRNTGLTPSQADVVFTLGNTEGMTFGELGERTLTTKGTLTGVVDRLEAKGLVERRPLSTDRRCTLAVLSADGERVFEKIFPSHIAALKERLDRLSPERQRLIRDALAELRAVF